MLPLSFLFGTLLQQEAKAPDFASVLTGIATALQPIAIPAFVLGIIAISLGTILSPFIPDWISQQKGYFLKAGLAIVMIGLASPLATWLSTIVATTPAK